jgi:Zn-dependent protease
MQPNTGLPVPQPVRREERFEERAPGPIVPEQAPRKRGLGAVAAVLFAILAQGKSLLLLLKALPAGKLLVTSLSMLAMVWFEAQRSGPWFAVGFVLCILVHELGHGYAMKRAGIQASWPVFIPFFGAMIAMKGRPNHPRVEADIAYGGPVAGTGAALVCAALGLWLHSQFFLMLAYTGFFLNLFNLIPLAPFDGGRITAVLTPRVWLLGVPVLVALFFWRPSPLLILMAVLAAPQVMKAWKYDASDPVNRQYYAVSTETRMTYGLYYLGLLAFLAVMAHDTHEMLGAVRSVGGH